MIEAKKMTDTKMRTAMVRLSYPHLFDKYEESGKYQCQLLIDKDDKSTLRCLTDCIDAAKEKGKAEKWGGKVPKKYTSPLHDGDEEQESKDYAHSYYISPKSTSKPGVVDLSLNDIEDADDVYPGCYVRATLAFYPYSSNGNDGVGVLLNNVQKLKDGERFGEGKASADSDFGDDSDDIIDDFADDLPFDGEEDPLG